MKQLLAPCINLTDNRQVAKDAKTQTKSGKLILGREKAQKAQNRN